MEFYQKLKKAIEKNNSLLCLGLDPDWVKLPAFWQKKKYPQFAFNQWLIEQTADLVCAFKLNSAFYEARGAWGIYELKMTFAYLKKKNPALLTILDAKRADIQNTNFSYCQFVFDYLQADAVTLNPYLGREALQPFLARKDKGCLILCRTSNPGAAEFQDLKVGPKPLYQKIAEQVSRKWNQHKNCLLVAGATYPTELKILRKLVGETMWFLVPGVGVQGGSLDQVIKSGQNKKRAGLIINSSRSVIFAKNPRREAEKLKLTINQLRQK